MSEKYSIGYKLAEFKGLNKSQTYIMETCYKDSKIHSCRESGVHSIIYVKGKWEVHNDKPKFASTSTWPLFESVKWCPWCGIKLEGNE